jgi:ubiquinone/menaquinone biosynthesis C-methylase UbiE
MRVWSLLLVMSVAAPSVLAQPPRQAHAKLFRPDQLGLLEAPDRDEWQQPERIMDVLGIAEGSRVADLGAGGGWFTIRLARRVGPNGVVIAEDIQREMIESIQRRVKSLSLANVVPKLGTAENPDLPGGLHAVLMVDTFPQLPDPVSLLRHVAQALGPNGRLGIVDFKPDGAGGPGPPLEERLDPETVKRDAASAGLVFRRQETFLRYQYFLVFGK